MFMNCRSDRFGSRLWLIFILASLFVVLSCKQEPAPDLNNEDVQKKPGVVNAPRPESDHISATDDFEAQALQRTNALLDSALVFKKNQLEKYLLDLQVAARGISQDSMMRKFFHIKKQYYTMSKQSAPPEKMVQLISRFKKQIQEHYILNYSEFYDILMVSNEGEVFYTIRKQDDYHKNLFGSDLKNTSLAKRLANNTSESFVDFQHYEISGEPSAFFVEPIIDDGKEEGWIVSQSAVNRINSLFARHEGIGETGEVILVNKDHYMLTNSRFKPGSSILIQKLADENISEKFKEEKGHKEVIDYRGFPVVSSFEVVDVFGSEWLIIAKMNKGEAISRTYMQNPELYQRRWLNNQRLHQAPADMYMDTNHSAELFEVDMDEFRREDGQAGLYTHGVATCTALLCYWPGKFAYLAHISPYDEIYGEKRTDVAGHVLRQIERFEVFPYQRPYMRFVIVSPKPEAFAALVQKILRAGYHLSQIHVAASPGSVYANIAYDLPGQKGWITWLPADETKKPVLVNVDSLPTVDGLL